MQRNDSKSESKNHGHDNEEHIEATVLTRGVEPNEQNSRESKCSDVASHWYCKQSNVPEKSMKISSGNQVRKKYMLHMLI